MSAVEILQEARDYLMAHGWTQLVSEDTHGKVCVMGALDKAVQGPTEAAVFLNRAADRLFPERYQLARFYHDEGQSTSYTCAAASINDHPKTTFNDVMGIYDEALLLAKEAQGGR